MSLKESVRTDIKNRCGKSELNSQLYRINREQKADMRMHNTLKQQFKTKYSKLTLYNEKHKDPTNLTMYEAYTPGFCYRRNGEAKPILSNSTASSTVPYEDIHSMLFTDGELDIDKILCLHLLTAHRTETLTPPRESYHRTLSLLSKDQSPLERLIERSRKRRRIDSYTKLTPTYILDINSEEENNFLITDGRLAERIIVNDKISTLVHTVLEALQTSNPEKMNMLKVMAKDEDALKKLVEKPELQSFLQMLRTQMIISSCESFHLTLPFKAATVRLPIQSSAQGLKHLINHIRSNVLQHPSQSTWKDICEAQIEKENSDEIDYKDEVEVINHKYRINLDQFEDNEEDVKNSRISGRTTESDISQRLRNRLNDDDSDADSSKLNSSPTVSPRKKKKHEQIVNLEQIDEENLTSVSIDHLSTLIDSHLKRLTTGDRKLKNEKPLSSKMYKSISKGSTFKGNASAVDLNSLDLAKISQEIREKETEKKLMNFLSDQQI